jgi:hypothetical protein
MAPGSEAVKPAICHAAGIQQPFGAGSQDDPRLRLYMASHPEMMRLATDPDCTAVWTVELRTVIDPDSALPDWRSIVSGYRREAQLEIYTTAAFDPPGLALYLWERLLEEFRGRVTCSVRLLTDEERAAIIARRPPEGFDLVHLCIGLEGFTSVFGDGDDFPILGVLAHFPGDGKSECWMDENTPENTAHALDEPDCLYVIRRPKYLGGGRSDPLGRIVVGGTLKPGVSALDPSDLDRVVDGMLAGVARRFGESFGREEMIEVTSGKRPGHRRGIQVGVSPDRRCTWVRGQAGMGIVTAYGCAAEINRLLG